MSFDDINFVVDKLKCEGCPSLHNCPTYIEYKSQECMNFRSQKHDNEWGIKEVQKDYEGAVDD